jgi:hypothetical protein
MVEIPID